MAPHSSPLAWKIPGMEEPGGLRSMGSLRVGHDWVTSLSLFTFMHWRRKWQPTPVFLPGESQGRGNLVGCHLWGHTGSDTSEATQQQFDSDLTNTTAPTVICLPWKTTKYLNANHLMSTHSDNTNAGIMPIRNMGAYVVRYERIQINDKHSFKKYLLVFTMSKIIIISPRDGKLWKKSPSINQKSNSEVVCYTRENKILTVVTSAWENHKQFSSFFCFSRFYIKRNTSKHL